MLFRSKANYPAEFMAAVLSRNLDDITKLTFYMDECKAMNIEVKGPDINESYSTFSVAKTGVIRFGLSAIKGIGADVVRNIIETREKGGRFKDIYDFVERVPASAINRRVFDNLVLNIAPRVVVTRTYAGKSEHRLPHIVKHPRMVGGIPYRLPSLRTKGQVAIVGDDEERDVELTPQPAGKVARGFVAHGAVRGVVHLLAVVREVEEYGGGGGVAVPS